MVGGSSGGGRMLLLGASCWLLLVLGSSERLTERSMEGGAIETQEEKELVSLSLNAALFHTYLAFLTLTFPA